MFTKLGFEKQRVFFKSYLRFIRSDPENPWIQVFTKFYKYVKIGSGEGEGVRYLGPLEMNFAILTSDS